MKSDAKIYVADSGSHMSSTSLPGNRKASDICDSPEAPNLKKVKLDECTSSEKPQKNMPSTASLFPVRSKLSDSCQQHAKLAAQQDVPSSAFKVSSGSSFNTESSDIISQEGQSDQTLKEDSPMESEAQETQNKAQDGEIKAQDSIENVMVASSPDCLKMEGREEGANDETVVCVTTGTVATDIDAQDMCSSDNDIEAMDSQEEGESQETQTEDSSSCEVWEQLPFFASEMDQLDETDGGNVGPKRVKKEAANKKKHGEKGGKKMVEKVTKPKKPPPNAFVAVRIPSPIISAKFEEVQRALQEKDERLKQVFVPAAKNHITLMVTRLNNPEEIVQYVKTEYNYLSI